MKHKMKKRVTIAKKYATVIIPVILLLCGGAVVHAQSLTRIRGVVTDSVTGEPLPFVGITVPGTTIGTSTDTEGVYILETRAEVSRIETIYLSYESQSAQVVSGAYNRIDFSLTQIVENIRAIKVTPGENPAHAILDSISHYKYRNNPSQRETYRYDAYTKMELDLVDVDDFKKGGRWDREFGFIFQYRDTSAVTGRTYLPVMISESSSEYYYRKRPALNREVIKASRISGLDDYNLSQYTGGMYVDVNLYDNYINIFEVTIPSPLSDHGRMFYNYYLIDSMQQDGRKSYYIRFHPKSLASPVFDGEIYIDAGEWALLSGKMKLAKGINVNWLRNVYLESYNRRLGDGKWFKSHDQLLVDFSVTKSDSSKVTSFMAQRQIEYSNIRIDEEIPPDILAMKSNVVYHDSAVINDEKYWAQVRPYELSEREKGVYNMVELIQDTPLYRNVYDLMNTLVMSYVKAGPVEFGSIYRLFSFNGLEGGRFQAGIRTNKDFHDRLRLSAYGAYGTKDRKFKGGGGIEYEFSSSPFSKLTLSGKHDVYQMSAGRGMYAHGNIFSSVFAKGDSKRLVMMTQATAGFEREWSPSVTNNFGAEWQELRPTMYMDFTRPNGTSMKKLRSMEVSAGARFAWDEIAHRRAYEKLNFYSPYPVFNVELTAGLKGVLGGDYEYYRATAGMHYKFNIPPLGRSTLDVSAGKIFGRVPYPLLKLHEGNATYFYDPGAFACMDFYEFASDTWASVIYEHHFRGFLLGRVPLLKKLQWREVFIVRALWGTLSDKNDGSYPAHSAILDFPEGMSSVSKPYIEAGVGIENIFRVLRVDAIWRLTHRQSNSDRKVSDFVVNLAVDINF